jgi:hypothetical protein
MTIPRPTGSKRAGRCARYPLFDMPQSGSTRESFDDDPEPASPWHRLSRAIQGWTPPKEAGAADFSRMDDEEKRAYISRIDPTERKVGLVASALGIALAIYANVPYMVSKIAVPTTLKPKGKTCPTDVTPHLHYVATTKTCNGVYPPSHYVLPLIVSLVLAIAIYVTVRIRRRAPLAFTMVITGLAFGSLLVLLPFGLGGAWVMLRAWRTQKYGAPTARAPVTGWVAPAPRSSTRRSRSSAARKSKAPDSGSANRKPPEASKRYTPKTPPKKKVAPPKS